MQNPQKSVPYTSSPYRAFAGGALSILGTLFSGVSAYAQESVPAAPTTPVPTPITLAFKQDAQTEQEAGQNDAGSKVPAFFQARRLSDADIAKKREGMFFTGLPEVFSDPVAGQGYGLRGNLYWNGKRTDPLFAYTPYRAKLSTSVLLTTGNAKELTLAYDMPFVNGSRWRLKVDFKARQDPTNLYFGITEATLGDLRLPSTPQGGKTYSKFSEFEDDRKTLRPGGPGEAAFVTDTLSNRFEDTELMLNIKGDYALGKNGRWRVLGGYEIQRLDFRTFGGRSVSAVNPVTGESGDAPNGIPLLDRDAAAGRAIGLEGGLISILQQALIYDTRDFEPDPTRGMYFEVANEYSSGAIGSNFDFDKLLIQTKLFKKLPVGPRTVLAGRFAVGNIFGSQAPFFEYQDQWSPDGSINTLSGARSLRGYRANRFMSRALWFANVELRARLGETKIGSQRFALSVVPFFDAGTVRDNWKALNFDDVRSSYGIGGRLAWNQSTVITLDVAKSREDNLLFFGIGQAF